MFVPWKMMLMFGGVISMPTDPVCGMFVPDASNLVSEIDGQKFYFCSTTCQATYSAPEAQVRKLKNRLIVGWILAIPVLLLTYAFSFAYKDYLLLILAMPVQFYSGLGFYDGAYHALRSRTGNMDLLVALGTNSAFFFSLFVTVYPDAIPSSSVYFDTSVFIVTLILTGNYIENIMKTRANRAAGKLIDLIPGKTHLLDLNGSITDVDTDKIRPGDMVLVKPGEVFPVDGAVTEGISDVDESMLTGEQSPVLKEEGKNVSSGTSNLNGTLKIRATRIGHDSTVSQIFESIQRAASGRVKTQRIADVFSSVFVPIVLASAAAAGLFWYFYLSSALGSGGAFVIALLAFVSVVVIACPCAIGLATPLSLLISSTVSSEKGIVVKNPSALDRLSKANRVIFDKTGTITDPDPWVMSFNLFDGYTESYVLERAAAVESASNHPVARAIVRYALGKSAKTATPSGVSEIPGRGITGTVGTDRIEVSRSSVREGSAVEISINGKPAGTMLLAYNLRKGAVRTIRTLHDIGLKVSMVTGDSAEEAARIAGLVGIDEVHAEVRPDQKAEIVRTYQEKGDYVVFVGDGINDTVALETSDVGIAMGSGSDIAKESGDIILLNSDIINVVYAKIIGNRTISKVKQNIGWAAGYNSALIPIAGGILVPLFGLGIYSFLPILAALAMGFSSVTVVVNSLFLRPRIARSIAEVGKTVASEKIA